MTKVKTITIPAAVDLHVHFREPGANKAETIKSGSRAALLGGYAFVCDMPNNPGNPTWTEEKMAQKQTIIRKSSYIPMATYAGSQPESNNLEELTKMTQGSIGLKLYGAATTGNHIDYEPGQFDKIVEHWHRLAPNKPIMLHSGKDNLSQFIKLIARKHKHPLHVCHVNSAKDVDLVSRAKNRLWNVTCGICPHHLFKTSFETTTEGWFARMIPPLARQNEAEKLFELFAEGSIDVIETDHAPHPAENKWAAENENPNGIHDPHHATCFGVPGIEFALPLLFYQMRRGKISLKRIVEATSAKPAKIIGVKISPRTQVTWGMEEYRIGEQYPRGISGSGWTPYLNNIAVGKVRSLTVSGKTLITNYKIKNKLPKVISQRGTVI